MNRLLVLAGVVATFHGCSHEPPPSRIDWIAALSRDTSTFLHDGATLVWFLNASDCLSCQASDEAALIRRAQRVRGAVVRVLVITTHAGADDATRVRQWVEGQRIVAEVNSGWESGAGRQARLVLVHHGEVVWSRFEDRGGQGAAASLASLVSALDAVGQRLDGSSASDAVDVQHKQEGQR